MSENTSFLRALKAQPDLNGAISILNAAAQRITASHYQWSHCSRCQKHHWLPNPTSPPRAISWARQCGHS